MVSNIQLMLRALIIGGLTTAVAACGGSGSSSSTVIAPPAVLTTAQEDKFGTVFGTDYRAVANSEPASVSDGDIVPVSLTTEPIPVN